MCSRMAALAATATSAPFSACSSMASASIFSLAAWKLAVDSAWIASISTKRASRKARCSTCSAASRAAASAFAASSSATGNGSTFWSTAEASQLASTGRSPSARTIRRSCRVLAGRRRVRSTAGLSSDIRTTDLSRAHSVSQSLNTGPCIMHHVPYPTRQGPSTVPTFWTICMSRCTCH